MGDEPPMRFDPDALIRRARNLRERRRALVAVAVAVLTIGVTATVLSLPGVVSGLVRFTDEVGPTGVLIRITDPQVPHTGDTSCVPGECTPPLVPGDGSVVESATSTTDTGTTRSVAHFRTDGTVVRVTGYGYDPAGGGGTRPEPPATEDQLVDLATDPVITAR